MSTRTGAKSITVFRSRLDETTRAEYAQLAPRMVELARSMPGFVSFKTFTAEDGERVSIVEFADEASEQAWSNHAEHAHAKARGRDAFFLEYNIKVCSVQRELVGGTREA